MVLVAGGRRPVHPAGCDARVYVTTNQIHGRNSIVPRWKKKGGIDLGKTKWKERPTGRISVDVSAVPLGWLKRHGSNGLEPLSLRADAPKKFFEPVFPTSGPTAHGHGWKLLIAGWAHTHTATGGGLKGIKCSQRRTWKAAPNRSQKSYVLELFKWHEFSCFFICGFRAPFTANSGHGGEANK